MSGSHAEFNGTPDMFWRKLAVVISAIALLLVFLGFIAGVVLFVANIDSKVDVMVATHVQQERDCEQERNEMRTDIRANTRAINDLRNLIENYLLKGRKDEIGPKAGTVHATAASPYR